MQPLLIGSRALDYHVDPEKVSRRDSDYDFLGLGDSGAGIEFHSLGHLNNLHMYENYRGESVDGFDIMTLAGLRILKRSHLHRPLNWDKHIAHYHKYLSQVYLTPEDREALEERKKLTYKEYGNRHPKLSQSNEDFFEDNVEKVHDHDYIHELYAYGDRPMFEQLKSKGAEGKAWCEQDLWDKLDHKDKVRCVAEECYVIATERFMVPNGWDYSSKRAYYSALRKVCTTLTSGWFRDFAIDYFPSIYKQYDQKKFQQVKGKLNWHRKSRTSLLKTNSNG